MGRWPSSTTATRCWFLPRAGLRARGAHVLLAAPAGTPGAQLPLAPAATDDLDPITAIQSFYPAVEALARSRGRDPDAPRHLSKVTRTH